MYSSNESIWGHFAARGEHWLNSHLDLFPSGLASVCIVTDCMTLTRARIEVNIPRKRKGACTDHDKVSPS